MFLHAAAAREETFKNYFIHKKTFNGKPFQIKLRKNYPSTLKKII